MFSSGYSRSKANLIHLLNSLFWPIPEPAVDQHWTTGPSAGNKCSQRNSLSEGKQETCDHPWPSPRGWTPHCVTGPDCKVQQVNRIKARKSRANFLFLSCFLTIEEVSLLDLLRRQLSVCLSSLCRIWSPPQKRLLSREVLRDGHGVHIHAQCL